MAILRIKPSMIEPLPGEKIPEIVQAREGKPDLSSRLKNVDATTIRGYVPINRDGDTVEGPLILEGGATIPEGARLTIIGGMAFDGPIARVAQTETTGTYGVSTVVASVCDAIIDSSEMEVVADFEPVANGNFLVYIYFRVGPIPTKLSIEMMYEDGGGLKHQMVINNEPYEEGSYSIPPIFINALAITPITISASSEITNQVYVSASIIGL